jgi:hypothetical protein
MIRSPLFPREIDINNISFTKIDDINNREYFFIFNNEENLYIQTPIFRFLEPINSNDLYLFLTPLDKSTFPFINVLEMLEKSALQHYKKLYPTKDILIMPTIRSEKCEDSNQYIKYMKLKVLENTRLEYNNKNIDLSKLNDYINKVNIKLIIEVNMIWVSKNKIGIYVKPTNIRLIDLPKEEIFNFREEIELDICATEIDYGNKILSRRTIESLNDSAFKINNIIQESESETSSSEPNNDMFIPNNNNNNNDIEAILKEELFKKNSSSNKKNSLSNKKNSLSNKKQDSNTSEDSIHLERYARKKKVNKRIIKISKREDSNTSELDQDLGSLDLILGESNDV